MRNFKIEGIVIRRKNFGEADKLLTLYSKQMGKIRVKAPGVRKIKSRRSPHVELFNRCILTLHQGSGFALVTEAQTLENFSDLKNDLTRVGFAYHICEIVDGLCAEHQENAHVFDLLQNALFRLANAENIVEVVHEFEIELLSTLGFWSKNRPSAYLDTQNFIENILERRLKSKKFISRLS
ncbi:MAG TPA: DNA repair protein RecO [Candidatus Saccharimonadales bacterium]|nr:DNA repair protein RecO [Candidatus Saccharimonadales bacterium]